MAKEFNVTGLCFPEDHYMADVSEKVEQTYKMVEKGNYFIINRPRQYGKTTMLYTISDMLIQSGKYLVFNMSFEAIGEAIFTNEKLFSKEFVKLLFNCTHNSEPEIKYWLSGVISKIEDLYDVNNLITKLVSKTNKKVILLIDDADKNSNNQVFVSFLAVLRSKYLERRGNSTFHSVVLASMHDVTSIELKSEYDEIRKYNAAWNIATNYHINLNLQPVGIKSMLDNYVLKTKIQIDTQIIADKLFYLTSGHPYLVSKLCKTIDEKILPIKNRQEWIEEDVDKASQLILKEDENVNALLKIIEGNTDLYRFVSLVINGAVIDYSFYIPAIRLGALHGIFARSDNDKVMIHNRIYKQFIVEKVISK
jgi:hypothetical protein